MCLTDRRLCGDVCAANHFGTSQRFLLRCFLPQGHQSWHLFTPQEDTFSHITLLIYEVGHTSFAVSPIAGIEETVLCGFNFVKSLPCSAISISLRPNSAFVMSLTQKSEEPLEVFCCFSLGEDPSSELSLNATTQQMEPLYSKNQHVES